MTIQVTGSLKDPIGNVSVGTEIRVVAQSSAENTLKNLLGSVVTGAGGAYSFSLVNGTHTIEVNFSEEYHLVGTVTVTSSTPTPITLPALMNL